MAPAVLESTKAPAVRQSDGLTILESTGRDTRESTGAAKTKSLNHLKIFLNSVLRNLMLPPGLNENTPNKPLHFCQMSNHDLGSVSLVEGEASLGSRL
jgi:hypothetical protein